MTFKMCDLKGINQDLASKLRDAGVENTEDMMRVWNDAALRTSVCAKTGITETQLTQLVSMARMARMKGIGPKYAELLVTAGITGTRSLSTYTPRALVQHLGEVNAARKGVSSIPTLAEVDSWFAELRPVAK